MKKQYRIINKGKGVLAVSTDNLHEVSKPSKVGVPGLSAYEVAVANGYPGTEEEWLETMPFELPVSIPAYIEDAIVQSLLEQESNWDINKEYIGTAITGTYQGQKHYDANYMFEAVDDDIWVRYSRI